MNEKTKHDATPMTLLEDAHSVRKYLDSLSAQEVDALYSRCFEGKHER
jgi:hypothetical protein